MCTQQTDNPYIVYEDVTLPHRDGKIVLRQEQKEAIEKARKHFMRNNEVVQGRKKFLWNAKMRFGKTLCALQLAKDMKVKSTLIVTHRPVVDDSWSQEFDNIMVRLCTPEEGEYKYGSKSDKEEDYDINKFNDLIDFSKKDNHRIVFFVSIQYLRRHIMFSDKGDNAPLKTAILDYDWDLIVVDEAHEGTCTSLGQRVIDYLYKNNTKMLHLSGTPFNLYDDFSENEIYTWDYIAEQSAKREWSVENAKKHNPEPEENNPYYELPEMKIFTYDLGGIPECKGLINENSSFQFKEFFRTYTGNKNVDGREGAKGTFVHADAINAFLTMMCTKSEDSNYPFSTDEYRRLFNHTLWVVPGVKEAKALKALLEKHPTFKHFKVVNVAGEKEDDKEDDNALKRVQEAIGSDPSRTRTITLSCGRLTTGVTVKPWTAVFYLKGSDNTYAGTYMQTIFRVQSPYTPMVNGVRRMKTHCYVFDFAPDRSLKMIAETAKYSTLAGKKRGDENQTENEDRTNMSNFLNFCPVISLNGGQMVAYDAESLFAKLEKVYIDRVVRNGYNDNSLYNIDELMAVNPDALNALGKTIEKTTNMAKPPKAKSPRETEKTADNGFNKTTEKQKKDARQKAIDKLKEEFKQDGVNREPTEQEILDKTNEILRKNAEDAAKRTERDNRIKILSGLSLRIPLLIFGAEVDDSSVTITRDNFTSLFRDENGNDTDDWKEFMPRNVSTHDFEQFKNCYNETVFSEAGKRIRQMAREADSLPVNERIKRITTIFSYFHNPDKETVLTPWRVVNMHMSDCLGGYCFFNDKFDGPNVTEVRGADGEAVLVETADPRFVDRGEVTTKVFKNKDARILEINSKTGLYPLYVTYSLYRNLAKSYILSGVVDKNKDKGITQELIDAAKALKGDDLDKELDRLLEEYVPIKNQYVIWDDVLRNNIFVICNTEMANKITRRTLRGFRDDKDSEELLHIKNTNLVKRAIEDRDSLVKDINSPSFWGFKTTDKKMKFNAIVGNPPYQINDGRGASDDAANPIYQEFVNIAEIVSDKYVSLIMPAKWMIGGKPILKPFRKQMMDDKSIRMFFDYENDRTIFENAHNDGGICYYLWDKEYIEPEECNGAEECNERKGRTNYVFIPRTGKAIISLRNLNDGGFDIVIRDKRRLPILNKIKTSNLNFKTKVSMTKPFGIRKDVFNNPDKYKEYNLSTNNYEGSLKIYGVKGIKGGAKRTSCYISKSIVSKNKEFVKLYKLFFTTSYSSDAVIPPDIIVAGPDEICTETFILIGPFNNESEQLNCYKYMQTDFFRVLLFFGHGTMQVSQEVFRFIPLLDFSTERGIDWQKSVKEINNQLFNKYQLSQRDIAFIESIMSSSK